MKIIVTHNSPDLDAIASVWLIKRFLPGWNEAEVKFVSAGERLNKSGSLPHVVNDARRVSVLESKADPSSLNESRSPKSNSNLDKKAGSAFSSFTSGQTSSLETTIEQINGNKVIHVDTGLGALDHHLTEDEETSAASLTFDFIKKMLEKEHQVMGEEKKEAIERMVKIIVDTDHFKEVYWDNPTADYHEFSFLGILEGLKLEKPDNDINYIDFGMECLDAVLHNFENRIWAEKEIHDAGIRFNTKWGKGIGFETINDSVLKLSQKMGYVVAVRRDPRKGYIRIKARPTSGIRSKESGIREIDLTPVYDKLKEMDSSATWFLHVSKKMLLNGTAKNPKMKPTNLSLNDIIRVLETI
ncbi:MAG: hypothetical protein Q7K55_01880 [Candidatus Levybacteria bacterium]|nr:hypothetical protein [Candidatus Levybacteria bacterium]